MKEKKDKLRTEMIKKRLQSDSNSLNEWSYKICRKIEHLQQFKKAKNILFYMPIKNEVNILPLLKKTLKSKNVILPKLYREWKMLLRQINSLEEIEIGRYGIPEPQEKCELIPEQKLDLIIVPGVAFDIEGNRMGFGKGFYDQLLKKANCPKIAPAYQFQVLENLPVEEHDKKMDIIISEKNIYQIIN